MPRLNELIYSIESVAPRSAQQEWDNSGMQVGDTERDIKSVLLTTDITEAVVNEAIKTNCDLIVSHHPLLFHGLKQVCGQTPQARVVELAIKHNIAIYSAHTSLDSVLHGISGRLAEKLGVQDYRILVPNESGPFGLGVIGQLPEPMAFDDFLQRVRETLGTTYIRYIAPANNIIRTIALCGGAGAEFAEEAAKQGADVYLTADCKYHEMQDAVGRIGIIDIDHWISERHACEIMKEIVEPLGVKCIISQADNTPIQIFN